MQILKKTLTNIRRHPYQSIGAIMVLTIMFFIAVVFSLTILGFYQALTFFKTAPEVLVFFNPDATSEQIQAVQTKISQNPQVAEIKFVSQQQALTIYQDLNQSDPDLLELVTADILPSSLEISTTDIESLSEVASVAEGEPGVDEVSLRKDVVATLSKWLKGLELVGIATVGVLAATSIIIVAVVVSMKISSRNYEIKVMRLIGASNWYIQAPFLYEGALYGLISAIIAITSSITLLLYLTPVILDFAGEVPLLPNDPNLILILIATTLLSGVLIGLISSFLAVKRFIKI